MCQVDRPIVPFVMMLATLALLAGCGGAATSDSQPAASNNATGGSVDTAAQKSPEDFRREFEENRRRIVAERAQEEKLAQHRRGFVYVTFDEFDADGRVVVDISNPSDRDIDDIRGGFHVEDTDGNILAASGYTEGVPGDIFLAAGQSRKLRPFISRKDEVIQRLSTDPENVLFAFEAQAITYADGTTEAGLTD